MLNNLRIFIFVSIGFIFVAISGANAASAASLYFSPSSGAYQTGRNFTVNINVQSSASINAASGAVVFPTDKLEAIGVSKTASIFNLWVQEPSFSNAGSQGNIRFEGIVLNPGFAGTGKLIGVTFRVKSPGTANLAFTSGLILANDGLGTNILSDLGAASFTLSQSAVTAPETTVAPTGLPPKPFVKHYVKDADGEWILDHDSETPKAYVNNRFNKMVWAIPPGITGISNLLNDKPNSNPGSQSDGYFDNKVYELDDGTYYQHIRFINASGAGPISHHKMVIDATPPEPFKIDLPDGEVTANPTPRILFETADKTSGIDRYEIKIDDGEWFNAAQLKTSSYLLPKLKPGEHQIFVRAYDRAGNYTEEQTKIIISPIVSPKITEYPSNIISPGEKLVVKGEALPKAAVDIYMNRKGQVPIIFSAKADEKGDWQVIYENIIPSGAYEVWAKQSLDTGAESLQSNTVYIGVNSWFWRALQWLKNIGGIIVVAIFFIVILSAIAYYLWHRFRIWRIKLRKEVREAESAVSKGFKKLKKEIKSGKTASKVAKDLSSIEKDIEKEIKDIK
ncbi:MAG: hypothetical protein HYW79_02795 [Parcubacteria group bacterium]|nr:hypothetical protein [Parcubacteria group bacterium]